MQKDMFNVMNDFGQKAFDTARRVGEINMRAGEKLLQEQFRLANAWVDAAGRNAELVGNAKTFQEMVSGQTKLAQEYGQEWLKGYRTAADILAEARTGLSEVVDEGVQAASENLKQATKKAA